MLHIEIPCFGWCAFADTCVEELLYRGIGVLFPVDSLSFLLANSALPCRPVRVPVSRWTGLSYWGGGKQ